MAETLARVNVAPTSDNGHFVVGAKNVIDLDAVTETFEVVGESKLITKNHEDINLKEDCTVFCQFVVNPLSGALQRSKD